MVAALIAQDQAIAVIVRQFQTSRQTILRIKQSRPADGE
ncbi:MAG: helix-turn-helix domain-containing protein [Aestuariivita sp.]|nr:helix-turn-helix domain-containing protein [Aestuariivita sp.]